MGLSKSKQIKANQSGFQSSFQSGQQQTGFASQGYPSQPGFPVQSAAAAAYQQAVAPNYAQQQPQQSVFSNPPQANYPASQQSIPAPQPAYQPQAGFPSLPPYQPGFASTPQQGILPAQQVSGFPGSVFPQSHFQSAPCYPVSYSNQVYKPLIPGYASAPANDQRRSNVLAQEQEQSDYSSRYYADQQISQIPQMHQMHKPRKH